MGDVHMEVREIRRFQLQKGMWLLPPYDRETGLTPEGEAPIPQEVHSVVHIVNGPTGVVAYDQYKQKREYVFTDEDVLMVVA